MSSVPGDVIVVPAGEDRWVALNVFARTCLALDGEGLLLLSGGEAGGPYRLWDVQRFANYEGLLADPTPFVRSAEQWPEPQELDAAALQELLLDRCLLVEDRAEYAARFAHKRSLLDMEHFGNFHQQLGQHLLLVRRENPGEWWVNQKFEPGQKAVRNNLYRAVQAYNLDRYLARRIQPGMRVLDVGCGTGFYANAIARRGADVLGVDPTAEFVAIAREHAAPGARYEVAPIGTENGLANIPDGSIDLAFMSDALLFYFHPSAPNQTADMGALLADIRRVLKPGGAFTSVEPHHTFWLLPWLGDADRPFTVMTEYLTKHYQVTASVSEFLGAILSRGFMLRAMEEWRPDPSYRDVDARAYEFGMQFPFWQLYEFQPA